MFDHVPHDSQHISQMGYTFSHSPYPGHPGSQQLDVCITKRNTINYFEPEEVAASIFTDKQEFGRIAINHPWDGEVQVRYRPGLIRISNRRDEIVDAYSLGGELRIISTDTQTEASFISNAPIFPKIKVSTISSFIASEIEDVIAMMRAHWLGKMAIFEQKIWDIPAENLYFLCIEYLLDKTSSDFSSNQVAIDFKHFLHNEQERLQASLQVEGSLEELFGV
jgi:hypothetical protein